MGLSKDEGLETKRVKICEEGKDFLSDLPDGILLHILSFLPIGDAIKTVLLRRFGNLWRSISVLDFNDCFHHICGTYDYDNEGAYHNPEFVHLIHRVLDLHEGSRLDKLCLKLSFSLHYKTYFSDDSDFEDYLERETGTGEQIDRLIGYAVSRNIKILDLDLRGCSSADPVENYTLPDVLRSDYLREMRLVACDFRLCSTISLKSLKFLFLDEVSISDEMMERLLLGCPALEDLSLDYCFGLRNLVLKNPKVKHVMLTLRKGQPLVISCPYVVSIDIFGCIDSAQLLDVSSLVDASIFFSSGFFFEKRSYGCVNTLLQKLSKCETFTPCNWTIMVLTIWSLNNVRCPSFRGKNLILKMCMTKWHHPGLSLLLRNCRSLKTLTIYIYPGWSDIFTWPQAQWIKEYELDGEDFWNSQKAANFPYLENIMIYGYINEPCVMGIVKFLLKSAVRLQKLEISTKKSFKITEQSWFFKHHIEKQKDQFASEQLLELSQKLLRLPRASTEATVEFS